MILAVDVGGSKTLVALFDHSGQILQRKRFETRKSYPKFLKLLAEAVREVAGDNRIDAVGCAAPGLIDRKLGVAKDFGNLPWHNVHLRDDIAEILPHSKVHIENDANLAGLSEALLLQDRYKKVLYLTVSTGIGDGIIVDGRIDPVFADSESGQIVLEHEGKLQKWEDFASGRALKAKYGKLASEIDDERIWYQFSAGLAQGIDELVATIKPEVIVIGGGVGAHFEKFSHFLVHELKKYENKMVKMPPIVKAQRPEDAVIYGCYEFAKQQSPKN